MRPDIVVNGRGYTLTEPKRPWWRRIRIQVRRMPDGCIYLELRLGKPQQLVTYREKTYILDLPKQ